MLFGSTEIFHAKFLIVINKPKKSVVNRNYADDSRVSKALSRVCVCVCVCVCVFVRTIKPKRLKQKSPNLA